MPRVGGGPCIRHPLNPCMTRTRATAFNAAQGAERRGAALLLTWIIQLSVCVAIVAASPGRGWYRCVPSQLSRSTVYRCPPALARRSDGLSSLSHSRCRERFERTSSLPHSTRPSCLSQSAARLGLRRLACGLNVGYEAQESSDSGLFWDGGALGMVSIHHTMINWIGVVRSPVAAVRTGGRSPTLDLCALDLRTTRIYSHS